MAQEKSKSKNQKTDNSSSSATTSSVMAQLLAKQKTVITPFRKGDIVKGKVTKLDMSGVLVDINAKSEAVVLEYDKRLLRQLLSHLSVGDEVQVSILDPESEMGHPVVSLRRFLDDITWGKLEKLKKDKTPVTVRVQTATRGGFVVQMDDGTSGFVPQSQLLHTQEQENLVGKTLEVNVLDYNRQTRKVIFSQKATQGVEDFKEVTDKFKTGDKIIGTITTVTPFGLFVSLPVRNDRFVDGLIHISELAWEKTENIEDMYSVGDEIEAVVIGFDKEAGRVDLSVKRLTEDPFAAIAKKYPVDTKVHGMVTKVLSTGVTLDIDGAEGFIKKEKIPPTANYKVGTTVTATVTDIDTKKHRIYVTPVLLEKPIGYR